MSTHDTRGFTVQPVSEQPAGFPAVGDEFEYQIRASLNNQCTVWTYRVIGWEKQIDDYGNERISVRVHPVKSRVRYCTGLQQCDMGHWHEVYDGDPPKNVPNFTWGFGGQRDEALLAAAGIERPR